MGLLSGLGSAFRAVANAVDPGQRDMSDPQYWADFGGAMTLAGVEVTDSNASQLGAVQSVRHGLTSAMKSLPASVYRRGAEGAREALSDHPVTRLFAARPNERQTPAEMIGELAWWVSYYRNAYCAIIPPGDPRASEYYAVGGLELLHPRRLALVERGLDGRLYYTFNPPSTIVQGAQLRQVTYREDELWHIRSNPLREDGLLGEPIFHTSRKVFARAIAVHDYGDVWFANYGGTGGIIKHPGTFRDKEDKQEFLDAWRASGTGRNRHRDKLLTHGADYLQLKVTNAEAQLLETEDAADTGIFGLWSYPPHRASRLKRATNNNIEQQSLEFVVGCLAPLAIELEQAVERDLLLDNENGNLFFEFNFFGLLRGDLLNRYKAYLIGRQGEWLNANDILRFENMSPRKDPGGNDYKNPLTKDSAGGAQGVDDKSGGQNDGSSSPNQDGNDD